MNHPYHVTEDTRRQVLEAAHYKCEWPRCYRSATEVAHRIAQTEANASMVRRMWRELFGEDVSLQWAWAHIIHNPRNLAASCQQHNSRFNCGGHPGKCWEILKKIHKEKVLVV